jgi:photosystem II stability/assembly factor-like uncharacterized protein
MFRTLIFLLICTTVFGQAPLRQVIPQPSPDASMLERMRAFDVFRQSHKLDQYRGWKANKRIESEILHRLDFEGNMPSGEVYLQAFENLQTASANARVAASGWQPAGPYGTDQNYKLGRVNCITFHPTDANTFYVGFGQSGLWKTTNGGQSYTPLTDGLPILRVSDLAIDPSNTEVLYATIGDMAYVAYDLYTADRKRSTHYGLGVYKSIDGGKSWKETGLSLKQIDQNMSLLKKLWINPRNTQEVVVTGVSGIYKTKNGGTTWTKTYAEPTSDLDQDPANPQVLMATGLYINNLKMGKAVFLRSEDGGDTWREVQSEIQAQKAQRIELCYSLKDPKTTYAVACDLSGVFYGFYRSQNAGLTWQTMSSQVGGSINVLGDGYKFYQPAHTTEDDYEYGQGIYDLAIVSDPLDVNRVYVGALTICLSTDGGKTWNAESQYGRTAHPDIHALAYNPLNSTFYNCNDGGVFTLPRINAKSTTNWKPVHSGINANSFYRLGSTSLNNDLIAGSQDNGSHYRKNNTWLQVFGGDGMECLLYPNGDAKTYIASYQYGVIAGFTKSKADRDSSYLVFAPSNFLEVSEWTTPFIYDESLQEIVIGSGNVYRYKIGQTSNNPRKVSNFAKDPNLNAPNQTSAMVLSKKDPKVLYLAKSAHPLYKTKAEVWVSKNDVWSNISQDLPTESYVSYLATDNTNADRVWATFSNFFEGKKVYESTDGGKTWQNISYNLPNIPANCIAYDDETGNLYVGMDLGIYMLEKNSKTWQSFSQNFPNVIVSELEINAKAKKIYAATFGRGLWESDLAIVTANEPIYLSDIQVFPNPSLGVFTLKASGLKGRIDLNIRNIMGQDVWQAESQATELESGKQITLKLPQGLYFLSISESAKTRTIKVLID